MAPSIGLGIVGSGFAARFHVENYRRVHGIDVRLVGVYSRRQEATAEFAKEYGFEKTYRSLEELLGDPEVEMVDTCVPNRFHEEMAVQTLQAGKTRRRRETIRRLLRTRQINPGTGNDASTRPWPAPTA